MLGQIIVIAAGPKAFLYRWRHVAPSHDDDSPFEALATQLIATYDAPEQGQLFLTAMNSRICIIGGTPECLLVCNIQDGLVLSRLAGHEGVVSALRCTADHIASACLDGKVWQRLDSHAASCSWFYDSGSSLVHPGPVSPQARLCQS
eukprot:m.208795 g.208795  ORF g.208795 m.208795 type:complete len:147 (+) comp10720_c0_seq12:599-1039(+)